MSEAPSSRSRSVAIIGAGPAGLIAAETLAAAGLAVTVHDRMPSAGRKFLMAGRGGLNLTHSEPLERFLGRYGPATSQLAPLIEAFPPAALREWTEGLDAPTFVGSSGRVFPTALKASPLLRAWLRRLDGLGVSFALRSNWTGFGGATSELAFTEVDGTPRIVNADAVLLALGGASWPRLGARGDWIDVLSARGVPIAPLQPANSGFHVPWSEPFRTRFAGTPLKTIAISIHNITLRGEAMVTSYGLEGGLIYALSAPLRDAIARDGSVHLSIDLAPGRQGTELAARIAAQKSSQSLSNLLRKAAHLPPVAINLLRESTGGPLPRDPVALAALIKAAPIRLTGVEGMERAISTAGGVMWDGIDDHMMLKAMPGVFVAGEMIDWEAPTGGYLLQACFATGIAAARGILARLGEAD